MDEAEKTVRNSFLSNKESDQLKTELSEAKNQIEKMSIEMENMSHNIDELKTTTDMILKKLNTK